jgi:hypothetical protein
MQNRSKAEQIAKILNGILVSFFLIAMTYIWIQSGHSHFDKSQAHLDMQN